MAAPRPEACGPSLRMETQEGNDEEIASRGARRLSAALLSGAAASAAQAGELTLCWAAWDPANALVELSKDFTAKTGIGMKFEFVPIHKTNTRGGAGGGAGGGGARGGAHEKAAYPCDGAIGGGFMPGVRRPQPPPADALLGRVGPGQRPGRTVQGLHQESGIDMKFEFVPWTSYADRFLNELNSHGKLCDLIIGDSQWIGGAAENGHYVKLNDFFDKEKITMDDFVPATVVGYSEWPKNTPNYWALPAMGDVVGWTYRKDWFSKSGAAEGIQGQVRLGPRPADDLRPAEADRRVLPGPRDRRQEGLRRLDLHRARLGRHHDGRDQRPLRLRLQVPEPEEAVRHGGLRQLGRRGEGPRVLQGPLQVLHAARRLQRLHGRIGRRVQIRAGRPPHELRLHVARPLQGPECRRRQDRLLPEPGRPDGHFAQLGGQGISVVAYSDHQDDAFKYIKWFVKGDVQAKWWALGGYSCAKSVVNDPGFVTSQPYAKTFLESMAIVKDFWAEPAYAELLQAMQKRVHDYVVADKGTAKEALDALVKDWTKTFKEDGKI